jgi:hypothetical protein
MSSAAAGVVFFAASGGWDPLEEPGLEEAGMEGLNRGWDGRGALRYSESNPPFTVGGFNPADKGPLAILGRAAGVRDGGAAQPLFGMAPYSLCPGTND